MAITFSDTFGGFGSSSSGSSNGDWIQVSHILILSDVENKEFTISPSPVVPSEVVVDIVGGSPQRFGEDYEIIGDKFNWDGLGLDGTLSIGDIIRLAYFG